MTRVPVLLMLIGMTAASPAAQSMLSPGLVAACVDAQQQVATLAAQMNGRLEEARQTNNPQQMRAALADLQAALVEIHTRAEQCSPLAAVARSAPPMAGMDHSRMTMGGAAPPAKPADPMAGMDHSKMPMRGAATKSKRGAKPPAKPADPMAGMDHSKMPMGGAETKPKAGAKPTAKPADPMAGMDHSKMPMSGTPKTGAAAGAAPKGEAKLPVTMAERVADPACPDNVGRADAPRATYQRKVYYFCSTADRDAFKKDPAGYLKRRPR